MILLPQKVAYRGTLTGLRISAVDGRAFLDACAALVPYADGSHLVEIYSATGLLRGYLAAAGDGEDAATDVLTGWNFTSGWTPSAGVTINDVDTFTTTGAGQYIYRSANPFAVGALYKVSYDYDQTAGAVNLRHTSTTPIADDGDANKYWTASGVSLRIQATLSATVDVTTMTAFAVTGPSADGATIVSAKGGATENFAYKDASFTFNATSYAVVVRKAR